MLGRLLAHPGNRAALPAARPLRPLVFGASAGASTGAPQGPPGGASLPLRDLLAISAPVAGPRGAAPASADARSTPVSTRTSAPARSAETSTSAAPESPTAVRRPSEETRTEQPIPQEHAPRRARSEPIGIRSPETAAAYEPVKDRSAAHGAVAARPTAAAVPPATSQHRQAPDIHIHIGTVEIRPVEAPRPHRPAPAAPLPQPVSLADYLRAGG